MNYGYAEAGGEGPSQLTGPECYSAQLYHAVASRVPLGGKMGSGWDTAYAALFLASDEAMSCTGGDFVVDAGLTVGRYQKGVPSA